MSIRLAVGGTRVSIIALLVRQSMSPVALGVGAGIAATLALARVMQSVLFETSPTDPYILIAAAAMVLIVTAASSAGPAWRASRRSPAEVLRA